MDPLKWALIVIKSTKESLYCAEGGQQCWLTVEFKHTFFKYKSTGFYEDGGVGSINIHIPTKTKIMLAKSVSCNYFETLKSIEGLHLSGEDFDCKLQLISVKFGFD